MAVNVTLAWDPSPDTNVVGYNVYYGTASRMYTEVRSAGSATSIVITGLVEGVTYYFAATAYDNWGLESDYSAETSYTIPLPVLNYPPTIDSIAARTINENAGAQVVALSGISSGFTGEVQTLVVTTSSSNPSLVPTPTVSYVSPDSAGSLTFTPTPYQYGTATISVTVNDGGITNNIITKSFLVTVSSVNQQPTLAALSNVTISEDAAPFNVSLMGISSGASNETQNLTVSASSSNTGLIPAPTVTYTSPANSGTLTLRPVASKSGAATITVTINDGGVSNNTISRTFSVTVNPVNDAPTINTLSNISVNRGAAAQTVNLSGIGTGASDEAQTLVIIASSSNPGLVPTPSVTYTSPATTGILRFTPGPGTGTAVISVTVSDGGAENTSKTVSFTVVVNAPPTISDIPHRAIALGSNSPPIAFTIADTETSAADLVVTASSSNATLVPNANLILGGTGADRTLTITPVPARTGNATITVTVSDGIGTASDTFQFVVQQRPTAPGACRVLIEGEGSVTPNPAGGLTAGQRYTLTAAPAPGQEFAGWSGSVTSSTSTIQFVAEPNTEVKALFVQSPFVARKGIYSGLFYETNEVRQPTSGYFALQSSSRGKYSGYLLIGSRRHAFSGRFALDCQATNVISRLGTNALTLHLALGSDETIQGEVTDNSWVAALAGDKATFHSLTNKAPWSGAYTLVMSGQKGGLPNGHSFGITRVAASGLTLVAGKLADGTAFTRTLRISKLGMLPVYMPLYNGKGFLMSWTGFEERATDDLHGHAWWLRPEMINSGTYTPGLSYPGFIVGSHYTVPPGTAVANFATSQVRFEVDNREFSNPIESGIGGLVKNLGTNSMVMSFVPGTGIFKGGIVDPGSGEILRFSGCVLQKQNAGYGWCKVGASYGAAVIE